MAGASDTDGSAEVRENAACQASAMDVMTAMDNLDATIFGTFEHAAPTPRAVPKSSTRSEGSRHRFATSGSHSALLGTRGPFAISRTDGADGHDRNCDVNEVATGIPTPDPITVTEVALA